MESWWTNLDMEIVCCHKDTVHYIQISFMEEGKNIFECKYCGQKYEVELTIKPIKELDNG